MTQEELIRELRSLLASTASIEESLHLRRELWQLVGDPATHTAKTYSGRVDDIAKNFHTARRVAFQSVRASGLYGNYFPVVLEASRGFYSLACLRVAGVLYSAHIVAVVDVKRHYQVVLSATQKLPAFA